MVLNEVTPGFRPGLSYSAPAGLMQYLVRSPAATDTVLFLHRLRHFGRLPRHDLPPVIAFQESGGVAIVRGVALPFLLALRDQAEVHDRRGAVVMNGDIVGGELVASTSRVAPIDVLHDLGLVDGHARRTRVDN